MPEKDHYVIIGNGPAGNHAADVLRKKDKHARISIISDENVSYYYKHLLPEYLVGGKDEESLIVRPYNVYKQNNIRLRLGQRVEKVDPENKILYLRHMEKVGFTKLILAVGGTPRVLPPQAGFEEHLSFLSNYTDALKMRPLLKKFKRITVLGGDLTSLSFIKQLLLMKKEIRVFLYRASFWPVGLTEDIVDKVCSKLTSNGVEVCVDDNIEDIRRKKNGLTVSTVSGDSFLTDIVFSFMGVTPNIKFIAGSGIDIERGVLVDHHLRSNYKDIYACGDCAQIYNNEINDYWISIGWDNAVNQGKVLANNILGEDRIIKPVSKKFLEIEGVKIKTSWWNELK